MLAIHPLPNDDQAPSIDPAHLSSSQAMGGELYGAQVRFGDKEKESGLSFWPHLGFHI